MNSSMKGLDMNIGIGTTDPQFTVQVVQDGKEILRITEDGKATPGEGLTVHEAVMAMCEMIRHEEQERLKQPKKCIGHPVGEDCYCFGEKRYPDTGSA